MMYPRSKELCGACGRPVDLKCHVGCGALPLPPLRPQDPATAELFDAKLAQRLAARKFVASGGDDRDLYAAAVQLVAAQAELDGIPLLAGRIRKMEIR